MSDSQTGTIKDLEKEHKWETSIRGRFVRWLMFKFGFSKCRHCINCEFEGDKHRGMRESIILTSGKCYYSQDSFSSNLDYNDLRKYRRRPGFVPILYNFKDYGIHKDETRKIYEKRSQYFFALAGWIVAIIVAILSV